MRKVFLPLLASLAIASPAMANDARVEARGGVIWSNGESQDIWGVAAGYDYDLGNNLYVGAEVSADKIGVDGTKVAFGGIGRLGVKAGPSTRVFAAGGYTTETCDSCDGNWNAGAGIEQNITDRVYVKAEYRHIFKNDFVTDADAVVGGVGIRF